MVDGQPDQGIEVQGFYFNGFQLNLSNADIGVLLMLNNQPTAALNMSYTTAKTLAEGLNEIVATLEKVTGRDIMTTKQVAHGLEVLTAEREKASNGQPN